MGDKILVYQDQHIINLMHEVRAHPKLMERITKAIEEGEKDHVTIFTLNPGDEVDVIKDFNQLIGFIAAHCGIALHGEYTFEDICHLCDQMRNALEQSRSVNVISSPSPIILQ